MNSPPPRRPSLPRRPKCQLDLRWIATASRAAGSAVVGARHAVQQRDRLGGIGDFDDELLVPLVFERDDDRLLAIADVPEDELAVLQERAGAEESRHAGARELQRVEPLHLDAGHGLRAEDVRDGYRELAAQ